MGYLSQIASKKGTDLLISPRGKFGLWRMVEKIKNCCDVGLKKKSVRVGSSCSVVVGNERSGGD